MSLLDMIRPKWQNSNPDLRVRAILDLSAEHQDIFEKAATSDSDPAVRSAAVQKLTSIDILRKIFLSESDPDIRRLAESRLHEEIVSLLKAHRIPATSAEYAMLEEVCNSRHGEDLLKNMPSSELRLAFVQKTGKQNLLAHAATKDSKEDVALAAVEKINSENLLQDISQKSRHNTVRGKAAERLKKIKESKNQGESATILLFKKREALLQQARALLESKDVLAHQKKFELLLAESQKMDMGPAQKELESIYEDFKKKGELERLRQEENRLKEREIELQREKLAALLTEVESLLSSETIHGAEDRVKEKIRILSAELTETGTDLAKRFASVRDRFTHFVTQKQEKIKALEKAIRHNASRAEILEQLKALTGVDVSETWEKQVKALTKAWENLPIEETENAIIESYHHVQKVLTDKLNHFSETAKEAFDQKVDQLQGLIDRVKSIDESEDFKNIAQTLRDTYNEWKDIVGEEKFKFQKLWKEYREATSRFQEMQQWESWHNEKDREAILEELTLLSKEKPCEEMLTKLKNLAQQWKSIGPTAPARFAEFRERFRTLYEQIMKNCEPILEEKNAEHQKNLERKESLTAAAEAILNDTTDGWKEKFQKIQEIQKEWKEVGFVPKEANQQLWDRFKEATKKFYNGYKDFLKHEDGERQKNYDKKTALCEQAEALQDSADWNGTALKLKKLQDEWKAIGSVPKVLSKEIWNRFRMACDSFFEKKRSHFDEMDSSRIENLEKKEALCARLEALDLDPKNPETVKAVEEIEAEWKSIGVVPKDKVEAVWDRFCQTADKFLDRLAEIDTELKSKLDTIVKKKEEMIRQITALLENAGSNQNAETVRAIQQEWKNLGRTGSREQELYRKFRSICDEFFTRRRDQLEIQEQARENNLQKKIMLCEQAEKILENLNGQPATHTMLNEIKHLRRLWKEIGAVPREHSDKIWKRFNAACDAVFGKGASAESPESDAR
ncbi:MAG: DUF349 domain-containing protein [Fibrobacter sp.]|nr:DUF349 domain-containing protein [Fibrobacter sp.]